MNLPPKTPTIKDWLLHAGQKFLHAGIDSYALDAEIILTHTLRKGRTYLHAHPHDILDPRHYEIAETRLRLRLDRTPIAYIIGHKEFYGRLFTVTPATLIPRPESEDIIGLLKEKESQLPLRSTLRRLVDVGTGSGCLGITAKLELPSLAVTLLDISQHALNVAKTNQKLHSAEATILQSNLLESYPFPPDIIVANLPYVDPSWERSPETNYEPEIALFAPDRGLRLIKQLIEQASSRLAGAGYLLLEADPRQHQEIIKFAGSLGFASHSIRGFVICLQR